MLKINPGTSIGQKGEILTTGFHSGKTNEGAGKNLPESKSSRKEREKSFLKATFSLSVMDLLFS